MTDYILLNRQDPAMPTSMGINNSALTANADATADFTELQVNTKISSVTEVAPEVVSGSTPIVTTSVSYTIPSSMETQLPASSSGSTTSDQVSLGAVIGSCIGSFAGLILVIIIAIWYSKRLSRKATRATPTTPLSPYSDTYAQILEPISTQEGIFAQDCMQVKMSEAKPEIPGPGRTKRSISLRFTPQDPLPYGHKIDLEGAQDVENHPQLVDLDRSPNPPTDRHNRLAPIMDYSDPFSPLPTMPSPRSVLPTTVVMQTPLPAADKWESAEVMYVEGGDEKTTNPFADTPQTGRRGSVNSPFFNAQDSGRGARVSKPFTATAAVIVSNRYSSNNGNGDRLQSLIDALGFSSGSWNYQDAARVQTGYPSTFSRESVMSDDFGLAFPSPLHSQSYRGSNV